MEAKKKNCVQNEKRHQIKKSRNYHLVKYDVEKMVCALAKEKMLYELTSI